MFIISDIYQSLVVAAFNAQEFLKLKKMVNHVHHWVDGSKILSSKIYS